MAGPWDNWKIGDPLPDAPKPDRSDGIGLANWALAQATVAAAPPAGNTPPPPPAASEKPPAAGGGTPPPSTRIGNAAPPAPPAYTPRASTGSTYTPPPPPAPGSARAGQFDQSPDWKMLGVGLAVDPRTGQTYEQAGDGKWNLGYLNYNSSAATRGQLPGLLAGASTLPGGEKPVGPAAGVGAQTAGNVAASAGGGLAGVVGTLTAAQTPHFSSLGDFRQPGLGFNSTDYQQMRMPGLNSVPLQTGVARRDYGFDFGAGAQHANFSGPAQAPVQAQDFAVPKGYMPGPSGYSREGPNGPYFAPVSMPFGAQTGGAGQMTLAGPQTVTINGGTNAKGESVGFGFNPNTILQDYGRNSSQPNTPLNPQTGDAATRAQAAMALMDKNAELQRAGMQPLDAYMALTTPSLTNYGAPMGTNPGAGDTNAGNPGAYGPDGPDRGFAKGGKVTALPGLGGTGKARPFADGGTVTPKVVAPLTNIGDAPGSGTPPPADTTTTPTAVQPFVPQTPSAAATAPAAAPAPAPIIVNVPSAPAAPTSGGGGGGGGGSQPGDITNLPGLYTPGDQPFAGYADGGTVQTDPAKGPATAQPTASADPTAPTSTDPAAPAAPKQGQTQPIPGPNDPNNPNPTANQNTNSDLQPYEDALTKLAIQQRQRDADADRYRLSGLQAPTGISTLPDSAPKGALPPGVFFDPSSQIYERVGQIRGIENQLAALGDISGDPFALEQEAQMVGAGYGGTGNNANTAGFVNPNPARAAQLMQQAQNIRTGQALMNQRNNLLSLGVPGHGVLPGFAGGGNILSGITNNLSGVDQRLSGIANELSGGAGQRLSGITNNYATGGSMTTPEEIIGIGRYSGRPYFRVGEPTRPGGPPMKEKLTIKPLHKPAGRVAA